MSTICNEDIVFLVSFLKKEIIKNFTQDFHFVSSLLKKIKFLVQKDNPLVLFNNTKQQISIHIHCKFCDFFYTCKKYLSRYCLSKIFLPVSSALPLPFVLLGQNLNMPLLVDLLSRELDAASGPRLVKRYYLLKCDSITLQILANITLACRQPSCSCRTMLGTSASQQMSEAAAESRWWWLFTDIMYWCLGLLHLRVGTCI